MSPVSIGGAWSLGLRFLGPRLREHAILLLVLGLLLPFALQFGLGAADSLRTGGPGGPAVAPATGVATVLLMAAAFLLQFCSYFASWRLGMDQRETLGRALLTGLAAALVALVVAAMLGLVAALAVSREGPPGFVMFMTLFALLPVIVLLAMFFTMFAALIGSAVAMALVVAMLLGVAVGQAGFAATIAGGGSGFVVVMLLILSIFLLWLSARLSCTAPVMADRRSLNLIAAVRTSWELTWGEQLRIMGYLALSVPGWLCCSRRRLRRRRRSGRARAGGDSGRALRFRGGDVAGRYLPPSGGLDRARRRSFRLIEDRDLGRRRARQQAREARVGKALERPLPRPEAGIEVGGQGRRMVEAAGMHPHPLDAGPPRECQRLGEQPLAVPAARQRRHKPEKADQAVAGPAEIQLQ